MFADSASSMAFEWREEEIAHFLPSIHQFWKPVIKPAINTRIQPKILFLMKPITLLALVCLIFVVSSHQYSWKYPWINPYKYSYTVYDDDYHELFVPC